MMSAARYYEPINGAAGHIVCRSFQSSLLGLAFNTMWCEALNGVVDGERHDFDYFVMLHADIEPEPGWLKTLIGEVQRLDADVVSVVAPIKNSMGVTSTALDGGDPWSVYCRLTLSEIHKLPETFDWMDVHNAGMNPLKRPLLVNTGCMAINLRKPWCGQCDENGVARFCFTINDRIVGDSVGRFRPQVEPEDWRMSRLLHAWGCKVYATRKVRLNHHGSFGFTNAVPYGIATERKDAA